MLILHNYEINVWIQLLSYCYDIDIEEVDWIEHVWAEYSNEIFWLLIIP